jgi:hypothetical protein
MKNISRADFLLTYLLLNTYFINYNRHCLINPFYEPNLCVIIARCEGFSS